MVVGPLYVKSTDVGGKGLVFAKWCNKLNPTFQQTSVLLQTPNKQCSIEISALPLPPEATKLLEDNIELIKELDRRCGPEDNEDAVGESGNAGTLSEAALTNIAELKSGLAEIFGRSCHPELHAAVDRIWSFGPRRCGPNVLIMMTSEAEQRNIW